MMCSPRHSSWRSTGEHFDRYTHDTLHVLYLSFVYNESTGTECMAVRLISMLTKRQLSRETELKLYLVGYDLCLLVIGVWEVIFCLKKCRLSKSESCPNKIFLRKRPIPAECVVCVLTLDTTYVIKLKCLLLRHRGPCPAHFNCLF